ncbi:MAG: GAF domain-containing protein [Planctomycetota bacterium]
MPPARERPEPDKESLYREVRRKLSEVLGRCPDGQSALASAAALLKGAQPHFCWVGFYRRAVDGSLRVGPYQGPTAGPVLPAGGGVCGAAVAGRETVIVPDVGRFQGHIACDPRSRSEIVVPLVVGGEVVGVLDVDSDRPDAFDEADRRHLEAIAAQLSARLR